jgi:hypothetical protein
VPRGQADLPRILARAARGHQPDLRAPGRRGHRPDQGRRPATQPARVHAVLAAADPQRLLRPGARRAARRRITRPAEHGAGHRPRWPARRGGLRPGPERPDLRLQAVGTIERNYGRDTADLATARSNEGVDYGRNVEALTRNYQQLGRQQGEQARKYGVTSGGIALLSAAKRAENQGLEQRDLDTAHQRNVTQFDTTGNRLGEDHGLALGQARTTYDRGVADRGTGLSRARTEDQFYGLDVGQQKQFQAQQAGYVAPSGPSNQFTRPDGKTVQTVRRNGKVYVYDQTGKLVEKRKAA